MKRTLIAISVIGFTASLSLAAKPKPSILFCTQIHQMALKVIDLTYLNELHERGFEVDYLDKSERFTWERIEQYNCLVIYDVPYPKGHLKARPPLFRMEFIDLLDRYLAAGGGVLLMKANYNGDSNILPLLKKWGARIPLEILKEAREKIIPMPRMSIQNPSIEISSTTSILPSPVSEGIQCIWYPMREHYNGCETAAIQVGPKWNVVYKGSPTSYTVPFESENPSYPISKSALVRKTGVKEPPLFAVREFKNGRIAFTSTWPVWSVDSGTQWLFGRVILSKGVGKRSSDFQKLLDNTYSWLSAPSLKQKSPGGYITSSDKLLPPNQRQKIKNEFADSNAEIPGYGAGSPSRRKIFRGIFGAMSSLGGGGGDVKTWAAAAREAGLDFLVFMDRFDQLSPETLEELKSECKKYSNDSLVLFPGYSLKTNIGDNFFAYGPGLSWPDKDCLVGPENNLLNLQYQDVAGEFSKGNRVLNWLVQEKANTNFGYYHFSDPEACQKMYDLRLSTANAVRTYKDGELLEDNTDDFLTTVQATISPMPISVNICREPADLKRELEKGNTITYAQADSLENIFGEALSYAHQYSGVNVFSSDGPIIRNWPSFNRVATYGCARFAVARSYMPALLWVTSSVGLKSVTLYDGERLFRRFLPRGATEFRETLELSGTIHRNIVLIAEDIKGGKAVSFPRRAYKANTTAVFCSDHTNDCGNQYIGRGIGMFKMNRSPPIFAGQTWDGGPTGVAPIFVPGNMTPTLRSNLGKEGAKRHYANIPYLDFADESGNRFISVRNRSYAEHIPTINAWYTFGPTVPSKLLEETLYYSEWHRPVMGPSEMGWAAHASRAGALPALLEMNIISKETQVIEILQILRTSWTRGAQPSFLMIADTDEKSGVAVAPLLPGSPKSPTSFSIPTHTWFGIYSENISSGVYFFNRGDPFHIEVHYSDKERKEQFYLSFHGVKKKLSVEKGQKFQYEIFTMNYPVNIEYQGPDRFKRLISYLRHPDGFEVMEGKRLPSEGVLEIGVQDYRARIQIEKPNTPQDITLPVRIIGLNRNWSAGYFQRDGYAQGIYGNGKNKYHSCAFDSESRVFASLYPDYAEDTDIEVGHPIVCDQKDLIIQCTQKPGGSTGYSYYIAINNPTDKEITANIRQNMSLPNLKFSQQKITVPAGAYLKLQ